MRVESTRIWMILICLIIRITNSDGSSKRKFEFFVTYKKKKKKKNIYIYIYIFVHKYKGPQCHDFAGDRSNCQRFIRCFHNLRVLFTCGSGTAYVPELQTCVGKELVTDCDDSKHRIGKFYSII